MIVKEGVMLCVDEVILFWIDEIGEKNWYIFDFDID